MYYYVLPTEPAALADEIARTAAADGPRPPDPHRLPALHRALVLRDRGCAFPACPHTLFLNAHHIHHWAHGGPTTLRNLVLLCTTHHRLVHEGGFGIRRDEDGRVVVTGMRGEVIAIAPAPCELDGNGAELLAASNEESGLGSTLRPDFPDGMENGSITYGLWTPCCESRLASTSCLAFSHYDNESTRAGPDASWWRASKIERAPSTVWQWAT
jgi:hypothetical protein